MTPLLYPSFCFLNLPGPLCALPSHYCLKQVTVHIAQTLFALCTGAPSTTKAQEVALTLDVMEVSLPPFAVAVLEASLSKGQQHHYPKLPVLFIFGMDVQKPQSQKQQVHGRQGHRMASGTGRNSIVPAGSGRAIR